jgi:hypothetical protein
VVDCCEQGNEPSGVIIGGEIFLTDERKRLKKDSPP